MDCAVVVLSRNVEGTKSAAGYLRRVIDDMESTDIYVVAAGEGWDEVEEIAGVLYGGTIVAVYSETVVEGVNRAVTHAVDGGAEMVHVIQSDVMVSPIWRSAAANSRMLYAAVGPCGPQLSGSQYLKLPDTVAREGFSACATFLAGRYAGNYGGADYLDPECFAISAAAWVEYGEFYDPGDLGFALRDWCHRVRVAGRRVAAVPSAYAAVFDPRRLHAHEDEDVTPRLRYYERHREITRRDHDLSAVMIVHPSSLHQLAMISMSLRSVVGRVDRAHVVIVDHPARFLDGVGPALRKGKSEGLFKRIEAERDEMTAAPMLAKWLAMQVPDCPELVVEYVPPGWSSLFELEARVNEQVRERGSDWCLLMQEGDLLEAGVGRDYLDRLMSHPDPMVVAYNVGTSFLWESETVVREDAPYGDGGNLTGVGKGTNDWKLYRCNGSRQATDGGRVANLRFQQVGIQRGEYRRAGDGPVISETGMRCSAWSDTNRIGLHMLAHAGENAADVARWLDWTHGLVDLAVVVMTDCATEGTIHGRAVSHFGAIFGAPSTGAAVDFAAWRNDALAAVGHDVDWAWFVDPDEWVNHPVHNLIPIRRMAEQPNRFAYLQEFINYRTGGGSNITASVRMARQGLGLRFDGRVHETYGNTLVGPQKQYGAEGIAKSPFKIYNRATADVETSLDKLAFYEGLIREELAANPSSARHWILLGYQYAADGHADEAWQCLDNAVASSGPTAYLAHYERAMIAVRACKADLEVALARLPAGHHHQVTGSRLLSSLQGVADAAHPAPDSDPEPLPDFPEP